MDLFAFSFDMLSCALILTFVVSVNICHCEEWTTLYSNDNSQTDWFGYSVAMEDSIIIVGTPQEDTATTSSDQGASYIFEQNIISGNWSQTAKLLASDGAEDDYFGISVDVSTVSGNNRVIIGASGGESSYVFEKDSMSDIWQQVSKLVSNNSVSGEECGHSVAIYDNYAAMGCYDGSNNRVAVFKYILTVIG